MPELDGFLRAIVREPADDTPRLALADWFDEHDQPALAAHLRGPGRWHLVSAATVEVMFGGYPAGPRRRYLVWCPDLALPSSHDPARVVGPARLGYPRAWGVRCHCGHRGPIIEFSGGAWHCPGCPPSEAARADWEFERVLREVDNAIRDLAGILNQTCRADGG